ncbi:hypothetical protein jhhlp_002585 [Lomentospora prolificans]|uniref:Uncharacterized protein n=1 Tax=Lomentospora prolificans TaxID=41688 RepID=A0A2N3NEG1_9PEZI|nr:hypothetical protein jhhlp_002585 [Lomentospora prolificans]
MAVLTSFIKWLELKKYQLEVTFSVYIYTPIEKFIFWSFVFLLAGLTSIAMILYLPHHILFLINRAWFYAHGDSVDVLEMTKEALAQGALNGAAGPGTTTTVSSVMEAATEMVREL